MMPVPRRSPHSISHTGPRHDTRRSRGRTHVSTRRRAAPRTTILLAPKGASTHVARIRDAGALTPTPTSSGDTDVGWASQVQYAVEHMDRYIHLGGPTLLRVRAQLIPDHAFVSADRGLGSGLLRVPGGCLPGPAAPLGNELKMAVPLGGRARGRLA